MASDNSYGKLIDDFDEGFLVLEGESLSDYITRMGGVDYTQQKAAGGITGDKTYHQVRDQFIPMDSEQMQYANGGGVGSMMIPKRGMVDGPGGYAGFQEDQFGLQYGEGQNPYAPNVMLDVMPELNSSDERMRNINDDRAEVLQQDIDSSKGRGFKAQDLDTLKSIEFVNPNLSEFELKGLKDGSITKPGNYSKSQASLNNGIMENIGNFFFTPAAAAESEVRPDNNLNSFGLNANQFSITDQLQQDVNKDIYNGYRPEQPQSFRSMTQNQNVYEPEKISLADRLDSGINTVKNFGKNFKNTAGNFKNAIGERAGIFKDVIGAGAAKMAGLPGMAFTGIKSLVGGMDQFDDLSKLDQQFILNQAGGNRPSKDPFGINRRSAFGNYGAYVDKLYEKDKDKVYDPKTQKFLYDRKVYNDVLGIQRAKAKVIAEQQQQELDTAAAALAAANTAYTSRGTKIDFGDYYNADGTANKNSSTANNPSLSYGGSRAKGGFIGYKNGGLASMFKQKK